MMYSYEFIQTTTESYNEINVCFLTEQAVAEPVPDARRLAPHPSPFDARSQRKVDPDDRNQKVAEADVDQQQAGGGPEALEFTVQQNHKQVVAEPKDSDGSDDDRQKFVGTDSEDGPLLVSAGSAFVCWIHGEKEKLFPSIVRRARPGRETLSSCITGDPGASRAAVLNTAGVGRLHKVGQCTKVKQMLHFR